MARAVEHLIPGSTTKRTLVIAEDPWLRFRLERELEQAGCEVVTLARLRPDELSEPARYDVVLTDAALFPEGSRLEALRALRRGSPDARFVLLVGPDERGMAEQARQSGFDLVLERPTRAQALAELVREALAKARPAVEAVPVPVEFEFEFVLPQFEGTGKRRVGTTFTSLMIHMAMLLVMLVIPLMVTETLDIRELTETWLVAPPPPPPPPPVPATALVRRVRPVLQTPTGKLVAPTVIPKEIGKIVEANVDLDSIGVLGGVPGGVAGGQLGGVIGGVLGSIPVPRPVPVTPPKPVRVGGNVRPPRLLQRVEPLYPPLARQARLQGEVRIDAVIDATGHVVEMKVLSGHPLLARAAMEAVQQWVYEPTYLNEQPMAVVLELTVYFKLQ